jgi:hypothetical protein
MSNGPRWTEDDEVVRKVYPISGADGVQAILYYRTRNAIVNRASVLSVKGPAESAQQKASRKRAISEALLRKSEDFDPVPVRQVWLKPGQWPAPVLSAPRSVFEVAT